MKSWRSSTLKQYDVYLKRYLLFCQTKKMDPHDRNIPLALEFFRKLLKQGYSYSSINTARSALSAVFPAPPLGEDPLVVRFMKTVYNLRPNLPKYIATWDVSIVLKYIEKQSPAKFLSLSQLTHKLITLLALVTGQRIQTLHALNLQHCKIENKTIVFTIMSLLKHSKPSNKASNQVVLHAFDNNKKVCPVFLIKYYIRRTKSLRDNTQLFISPHRPHHPVAKSTLSRWVKLTLAKAGINTDIYTAHSTRSASTSAAAAASVDISKIMKAASWTNASTFKRFYRKDIVDPSGSFGNTILKKL